MISRNDVLGALMMGGIFRGQWWPMDDAEYSTVSPGFVTEAWREWVRSLPPELVEVRDIGGGKTQPVPRWIAEVFDCDNHTRDFATFLNRCMAVDAAKAGTKRGNTASGMIRLFTQPGVLASFHAAIWFIDHEQEAHTFDPATGRVDPFVEVQLKSIESGESL